MFRDPRRRPGCHRQAHLEPLPSSGSRGRRVTTQAEALLAHRPDFKAGRPLLSVRDLRTNLLKPASFTLSAGECVAVRGPSGGGKTLLLRAIADLDPNEGRVCLDGRDRSTRIARRFGVSPLERSKVRRSESWSK